MTTLPVQSLGFKEIKENFKEFLKANPSYKDFNFEGSGISTLLNILAYNTHYTGFYTKMLLDEAFVDSSHTKQALLSHAKRVGYIPKGMKAARAELILKINTTTTEEPESKVIKLERGATFTAANDKDDLRTFTVLDSVLIDSREAVGSDVTYTSDPITVYEGSLRTWKFIVDSSVVNQRFVIKDPNIDIDTLRVRVKPDESSLLSEEYQLVSDIIEVESESKSFYVTTDEFGYYQIFFGNNIFGNQPENNNVIEVTFITTNGPEGNGAKKFNFNSPAPNPLFPSNIGNFEDFEVVTTSVSSGGMNPETIDDLKFAIPSHWRRQNRAFNVGDFRSILLTEFRNIDSINVWGGEEHIFKNYGKVYVSIKPKHANRLTTQARNEIKQKLLHRYGWVGLDLVFVDPEFITVDVELTAKVDRKKTNLTTNEIKDILLDKIHEYGSTKLSKFDTILSDVDFLNFVMEGSDGFVTSSYSTKLLRKEAQLLHNSDAINTMYFGNQIVPGSVSSTDLTYGSIKVHIRDDSTGGLWLFNSADGTKLNIQAGSVDYKIGTINYKVPKFSKVAGYESSNIGILEFSAKPQIPDINTSLNNIVRLGKVKVVVA